LTLLEVAAMEEEGDRANVTAGKSGTKVIALAGARNRLKKEEDEKGTRLLPVEGRAANAAG
jgi:hypothetical protein